MTLDIKAIEQRIAELRADDAKLNTSDWTVDKDFDRHRRRNWPNINPGSNGGSGFVINDDTVPRGVIADCDSFADSLARTRNSLASTADMLETLRDEVEALRDLHSAALDLGSEINDGWYARSVVFRGERDTARAEVARLTAEVERMRPVVEAADTWRDDTRKGSLSRDGYELQNAVDNYRARKAWTCPGCNLPYGVGCESWTAARSHGAKLCLSCQKTGRQP